LLQLLAFDHDVLSLSLYFSSQLLALISFTLKGIATSLDIPSALYRFVGLPDSISTAYIAYSVTESSLALIVPDVSVHPPPLPHPHIPTLGSMMVTDSTRRRTKTDVGDQFFLFKLPNWDLLSLPARCLALDDSRTLKKSGSAFFETAVFTASNDIPLIACHLVFCFMDSRFSRDCKAN
jgi:hypothetical protein